MKKAQWSVSKKADRLAMAQELTELLARQGVNFTRAEGNAYPGPRCIAFKITAARGLSVRVAFDGDSCQPDVYVLSWHFEGDSDEQLNEGTFGGSVNQIHRHKATHVAYGFEALCASLERSFKLAADGVAFLPKTAASA